MMVGIHCQGLGATRLVAVCACTCVCMSLILFHTILSVHITTSYCSIAVTCAGRIWLGLRLTDIFIAKIPNSDLRERSL